jgi:Ribonuclease E/G family
MSSRRRLFLDEAVGERRAVVWLDGRPERLLLERPGDAGQPGPGAVVVARIASVEKGLGVAFLEGPDGASLMVARAALPDGAGQGRFVRVQVLAPARRGKAASGRVLQIDAAPVRWITPTPSLLERLQGFAPGCPVEDGAGAREAADHAVEEALAVEYPLRGGGRLTLEQTRALVAVDVDMGSSAGQDARAGATRTNQIAISETARLLRLKGLGGLVIIDLAGKGHNGPVLMESVKAAFGPDQPGVAVGPISKFGVLELTVPWRTAPVAERLVGVDGRPDALSAALALLRAIERAALPGRRVEAVCAPDVATEAEAHSVDLTARIGPRFQLRSEPGRARDGWEVVTR